MWEPLEQFKEAYPDFKLEGKLFRRGGSVVDAFFSQQYARKPKKPASAQECVG
jgi:hypothetical protein